MLSAAQNVCTQSRFLFAVVNIYTSRFDWDYKRIPLSDQFVPVAVRGDVVVAGNAFRTFFSPTSSFDFNGTAKMKGFEKFAVAFAWILVRWVRTHCERTVGRRRFRRYDLHMKQNTFSWIAPKRKSARVRLFTAATKCCCWRNIKEKLSWNSIRRLRQSKRETNSVHCSLFIISFR